MLKWLRQLKAWLWLQPQRYLSGLPTWDDLPAVTRLPVPERGPYIPPCIKPEALPKVMGIIWCWDHARPLGWREYQYWQTHVLPLGWGIIAEPEVGPSRPERQLPAPYPRLRQARPKNDPRGLFVSVFSACLGHLGHEVAVSFVVGDFDFLPLERKVQNAAAT